MCIVLRFCTVVTGKRSRTVEVPTTYALNLSDRYAPEPLRHGLMNQDRSDSGKPTSPPDPLWPLVRPHVTVCDAMVTATVRGGAFDLCLTNGSFIIPLCY
ncbi:unnamed protein product [Pleuronectes platessa]|uniref:Uncharacterized protein n=1 Tax=Pleuronectes platessa TaxID=8262 RepID=A0A9N7V4P2_PLEPL|nr:unnamed protein product [Pleuronectes platessa]